MQTLLTSAQMRETDAYTIEQLKISSLKLMEKAAKAFVKSFKKEVEDKTIRIAVLCGPGNNGGDGLAIARLLADEQYEDIKVYVIDFSAQQSDDFKENLIRLSKTKTPIVKITDVGQLELQADLIIDAIFGSGLDRPLSGKYLDVITTVNELNLKVIAVDVPSGFNAEGAILKDYKGIRADLVISFQRPKINFFFPESSKALDRFKVIDINLDEGFIEGQKSNWKLTDKNDVENILKKRKNFSHKGTYGHVLMVAGNITTMGAALLSASACLHAGAGLTTVCLPQSGLIALNATLPEVMALPRSQDLTPEILERFNVIAIGSGLGVDEEEILTKVIHLNKPLVIDADALTMLSKRRDLLDQLPVESILTPHMKEFDRIFGNHEYWWDRVETARKEAMARQLIIVLKNQYTFICLTTGEVRINQTGNPAMASGGMGDVLTGIIAALLAQSYTAQEAVILATYLHGKAGDQLAKENFVVTASQVAAEIPKVMKKLSD